VDLDVDAFAAPNLTAKGRHGMHIHSGLHDRDFVPRHLVQYLRFTPSMREKIDEVENERAHSVGSDRGTEMPLQLVGVLRCRDFLIADRSRTVELLKMSLEKLFLVSIE